MIAITRSSSTSARALGALALFALLASACTAGRALVATPADYSAFRATRVATSLDERVAAAGAYLASRPDGAFVAEVRADLERVEPAYWGARRESVEGLDAYLAALPEGPHAVEARARRAALSRSREADEGERLARRAALAEARLEAASRARRELLDALASSLAHAHAALRGMGAPLDSTDPDVVALLGPPGTARCVPTRCARVVSYEYAVPSRDGLVDLVATVEIAAELDRGALTGVTIGGPELFTRAREAGALAPAAGADEAARADAIAWAIDFASGALEAAMPAASCAATPSAPAVAARACDGRAFAVVPASDRAGDDRFVLSRGRAAARRDAGP